MHCVIQLLQQEVNSGCVLCTVCVYCVVYCVLCVCVCSVLSSVYCVCVQYQQLSTLQQNTTK